MNVFKKNQKFVRGYTSAAVGLSVGSSVLDKIGGNVAQSSNAGLGIVGNFLPTIGTLGGAQMALDGLKMFGHAGGLRVKRLKR